MLKLRPEIKPAGQQDRNEFMNATRNPHLQCVLNTSSVATSMSTCSIGLCVDDEDHGAK